MISSSRMSRADWSMNAKSIQMQIPSSIIGPRSTSASSGRLRWSTVAAWLDACQTMSCTSPRLWAEW